MGFKWWTLTLDTDTARVGLGSGAPRAWSLHVHSAINHHPIQTSLVPFSPPSDTQLRLFLTSRVRPHDPATVNADLPRILHYNIKHKMLVRSVANYSTAPGRNAASPRQRVVAFGLKENVAKLAPITDIARVRIPALGWSVENVEVGHVRAKRDSELTNSRARALLPTSNTQAQVFRPEPPDPPVGRVHALMCTSEPACANTPLHRLGAVNMCCKSCKTVFPGPGDTPTGQEGVRRHLRPPCRRVRRPSDSGGGGGGPTSVRRGG